MAMRKKNWKKTHKEESWASAIAKCRRPARKTTIGHITNIQYTGNIELDDELEKTAKDMGPTIYHDANIKFTNFIDVNGNKYGMVPNMTCHNCDLLIDCATAGSPVPFLCYKEKLKYDDYSTICWFSLEQTDYESQTVRYMLDSSRRQYVAGIKKGGLDIYDFISY